MTCSRHRSRRGGAEQMAVASHLPCQPLIPSLSRSNVANSPANHRYHRSHERLVRGERCCCRCGARTSIGITDLRRAGSTIFRSASGRSANSRSVTVAIPARASIPPRWPPPLPMCRRRPPSSPYLPPSSSFPFNIKSCIPAFCKSLSICPRGPLTAGPLRWFSMRKCTPALSASSPMTSPNASTSLTRWPLPMPPMRWRGCTTANMMSSLVAAIFKKDCLHGPE
mmetsp:Transcript_3891/g.11023  ORF Transcript_3891/g.11023 Transcript_3891/m.11023 type:complete len:225 (+) Transcript_3891:18-692(+)